MLSQECIQIVQVDFVLVITADVLQGDTFAQFLFMIVVYYVDYILQQTDESHELKTHAENPDEYPPDLVFLIWTLLILCLLMWLILLLQNIMTRYKRLHLKLA